MAGEPKRHVEVRLLVVAVVEVTNSDLIDVLAAQPSQPSSIPNIVAQEIVSNLESIPYVDTVIVSHL
jgi:hypothetical protein